MEHNALEYAHKYMCIHMHAYAYAYPYAYKQRVSISNKHFTNIKENKLEKQKLILSSNYLRDVVESDIDK